MIQHKLAPKPVTPTVFMLPNLWRPQFSCWSELIKLWILLSFLSSTNQSRSVKTDVLALWKSGSYQVCWVYQSNLLGVITYYIVAHEMRSFMRQTKGGRFNQSFGIAEIVFAVQMSYSQRCIPNSIASSC